MFSHFYVGSMCLMRRLHLGRYNYMSIIVLYCFTQENIYYLIIPFVKIHTIIVRCCCRTECSKLVFLLIRGLVTS